MQFTFGHVPQPRKNAWDTTKGVSDSPRTHLDATLDSPRTSLDTTPRLRKTTWDTTKGVIDSPRTHPDTTLDSPRTSLDKTAWDVTKAVIDSPRTSPDATLDSPRTIPDKTPRTHLDETQDVTGLVQGCRPALGCRTDQSTQSTPEMPAPWRDLPPAPPAGHLRRQKLTPEAGPKVPFSPRSEWRAPGVGYWYI